MTTPDRGPIEDAAEADVVEQNMPVADLDDEGSWPEAERVGAERDWQASEADLIEQTSAVPEDETGFDR
jgi:hypothetical protein